MIILLALVAMLALGGDRAHAHGEATIWQCPGNVFHNSSMSPENCWQLRASLQCGSDGRHYITPSRTGSALRLTPCKRSKLQPGRLLGKLDPAPEGKRSTVHRKPQPHKDYLACLEERGLLKCGVAGLGEFVNDTFVGMAKLLGRLSG